VVSQRLPFAKAVFTPTAIHMQFVVDKMTLGQASVLPALRFGPASVVLPIVHTHLFVTGATQY